MYHTSARWCDPLGNGLSPTPAPSSSGSTHQSRCCCGPCCRQCTRSSSCPCCHGSPRSCFQLPWSQYQRAGLPLPVSQPKWTANMAQKCKPFLGTYYPTIQLNLKTIHASLKRTNRINLSDIDDTPKMLTFICIQYHHHEWDTKECKAKA